MFRMLKFLDPEVETARSHAWLYLALLKPRLWWQCDCFQVPMSSHVAPGPSIWFAHAFLGLFFACSLLHLAAIIFELLQCQPCASSIQMYPAVQSKMQFAERCRHSRPGAGFHGHAGFETMRSVKCCTPKNSKNMTNIQVQCIYIMYLPSNFSYVKGRTWATVQIASQGSFCTKKWSWNHLFVFAFIL